MSVDVGAQVAIFTQLWVLRYETCRYFRGFTGSQRTSGFWGVTILEGYCDANWIIDTKDTKSTSGYVFTLDGAAVSWKSSKQSCIARSTME